MQALLYSFQHCKYNASELCVDPVSQFPVPLESIMLKLYK